MRVFASLLAVSLALAAPVEAAPRRVASLNLCTDELLLMLGAPGQIVSVTYLAQDRAESPLWRTARRYRRNDGSLISVAPLRPDLVIAMGGGSRDRVGIAGRLGMATLDLPFPASLADMERNIRAVAAALGRPEAGARLLQGMARLKSAAPAARADAAWLGGGGRSLSAQGIGAEWMALAGLRQRPLRGDRISLEMLLTSPPDILLRSDYRNGQFSGEQRWFGHPLARRAGRSRTIRTDGRLWTCMGPLLIGEIIRLRAATVQ